MTHVITSACASCKDQSCVSVCPVDCIRETAEMFVIHPEECIDCGSCVPTCPVGAIFHEQDVPPGETRFIKLNRTFFGL